MEHILFVGSWERVQDRQICGDVEWLMVSLFCLVDGLAGYRILGQRLFTLGFESALLSMQLSQYCCPEVPAHSDCLTLSLQHFNMNDI